jgi:molybdopterin-guanine dinucleotide biosynthesis protein A/molybdopterin converting factor small subunit
MGQPKALLPFAGEPLVVHMVRTLRSLFTDIVLVAAPEQELPPLPVTLVRDEVAYQGPVGGIYYGLRAAHADICFVTACDAPFLNLSLISYLIAQSADCEVVVPFWQDRLQPLHAVYRRSVAPLLRIQLERGELRPIFLYQKVRTREVSAEEIRRFDPEGLSFRNMNNPEDYRSALELWQEKKQRNQTEGQTEPPLLSCTVELFGGARFKAKTDRVSLTLAPGANLSDALAALAEIIPTLVGPVLTADHRALTAGYACNLNGTDFISNLHTPLRSGDSLLILSSDAGG